jgi:hypothetical protein
VVREDDKGCTHNSDNENNEDDKDTTKTTRMMMTRAYIKWRKYTHYFFSKLFSLPCCNIMKREEEEEEEDENVGRIKTNIILEWVSKKMKNIFNFIFHTNAVSSSTHDKKKLDLSWKI